jgi:hypothetical protein
MVFGQETMPILMEINFFKSREDQMSLILADNTLTNDGQKIYPIAAGGREVQKISRSLIWMRL